MYLFHVAYLFFKFISNGKSYSSKISDIVTINIMHIPKKILSQWVHGSCEKQEIVVDDSNQFLEKYTL